MYSDDEVCNSFAPAACARHLQRAGTPGAVPARPLSTLLRASVPSSPLLRLGALPQIFCPRLVRAAEVPDDGHLWTWTQSSASADGTLQPPVQMQQRQITASATPRAPPPSASCRLWTALPGSTAVACRVSQACRMSATRGSLPETQTASSGGSKGGQLTAPPCVTMRPSTSTVCAGPTRELYSCGSVHLQQMWCQDEDLLHVKPRVADQGTVLLRQRPPAAPKAPGFENDFKVSSW